MLQVNAGDAGEYTIGGLHDLDKGWMNEVKPCTPLRERFSELYSVFFIENIVFDRMLHSIFWDRNIWVDFVLFQVKSKGARILPRLLFDRSVGSPIWTLSSSSSSWSTSSLSSTIRHCHRFDRWAGKQFVELFSKEEKQKQLKKLLIKTAK